MLHSSEEELFLIDQVQPIIFFTKMLTGSIASTHHPEGQLAVALYTPVHTRVSFPSLICAKELLSSQACTIGVSRDGNSSTSPAVVSIRLPHCRNSFVLAFASRSPVALSPPQQLPAAATSGNLTQCAVCVNRNDADFSGFSRRFFAQPGIRRSRSTISMTVAAASHPLFPALVPARSIA